MNLNPHLATSTEHPWDALLFFNRGNAQSDLRDYNGAIVEFDQAITLNPVFGAAWFYRGNAKYELGDYIGALSDYNMAKEFCPELYTLYMNRGLARYRLKDLTGALEDFSKALEIKPFDARLWYLKGGVEIEAGMAEAGCSDLLKAVKAGSEEAAEFMKAVCR